MTEAASARYSPQTCSSRPPPSSVNPPPMPPFMSPRRASPHRRSNAPQTPSPNYFGFHADSSSFLTDSPHHAKTNWSPPSSAIRSAAALPPSVVPLDQISDYDAFRRHSEGKAFNLAGLNSFNPSMPKARPTSNKPNDSRKPTTQQSKSQPQAEPSEMHRTDSRASRALSTSGLSRSPKRVLSPGSTTESNRRGTPPHLDQDIRDPAADSPEAVPRFKLPLDTALNGAYKESYNLQKHRAETLPSANDAETQSMATAQHVVNLLDSRPDEILLLDLRVSTQYLKSHISNALNLCIPTTLLKRPSFNVHKLAETFKEESEQRQRFQNWKSSSYIIVYDANSAALQDAVICMNTIKKFRSEGYGGILYILKGGFAEFFKRFPSYVQSGVDGEDADGAPGTSGPVVAPVVGGCPMPGTDKPANPFFGNIRQNMDLIGGVGQMPVKHPSKETASAEKEYPSWLKNAASEVDQGKSVSNKFEQIERREKKRMEDALSGKVSWGTPNAPSAANTVQIAGIEKGDKNRYNNIWPFEHTRVKLLGVSAAGCDYFNASYIKAPWSNKRYISTQAPIPATINDFWSVVWQQDVRMIVMLTAEKEGAQVKAHNYWSQKQNGPIQLDFISEKRASLEPERITRHQRRSSAAKRSMSKSQNPDVPLAQLDKEEKSDQPYVIVRKFTIKHEKYPFEPMREITQLHYSNWPDFGAPAHPAHLLGLVEQCDNVVRASHKKAANDPEPADSRPVLVHCSAGCGRTGTFCTIDTVIDMLKRQRISDGSRPAKTADAKISTNTREGSGHSDFFSSQSQQESTNEIEGSWVYRDDQDLVEKTVEGFRRQRLSMVQNLRQYVLCYESVMEWLVEQRRADQKATD